MGWERRGKGSKKYYYRSMRRGKQVEKQYVPAGPLADLLIRGTTLRRAEANAVKQIQNALRVTYESADQSLTMFEDACLALRDAALVLNGYHKRAGQWRRRRYG